MTTKMPRGAIPTPRSELAASEPYRPGAGAATFVPSGEFPTPNPELAGAQPYRTGASAPLSFLSWPIRIDSWGNEKLSNSSWAEEAFAKACVEPRVFIPPEVVLSTARECGSSNFAAFVQTRGFQLDGKTYLDGSFYSVDWTNEAALHGAIANTGPVKIGVASANIRSGSRGQVTPGTTGWALHGLLAAQPEDQWASLFGYGPLAELVDLFKRQGVKIDLPPGAPSGLWYAMFLWDSIGIVNRDSILNITGEAWVRNPTTILRNLNG